MNEVLLKNKNAREKRGLEPKTGPQSFEDRFTTKIDYCGARPQIFKYFHIDIFREEVRKLDSDVRVQAVSERIFVQALQTTSNRMAN